MPYNRNIIIQLYNYTIRSAKKKSKTIVDILKKLKPC